MASMEEIIMLSLEGKYFQQADHPNIVVGPPYRLEKPREDARLIGYCPTYAGEISIRIENLKNFYEIPRKDFMRFGNKIEELHIDNKPNLSEQKTEEDDWGRGAGDDYPVTEYAKKYKNPENS